MAFQLFARNDALAVNDGVAPKADLRITTHGSDWYFSVCAVMGFSTLAYMALAFRNSPQNRLFHYITAAITATACIAYFSMGSGLGQTPVPVEFRRPGDDEVAAAGTRELFYARYIDWAITTPLLLLDLLLTAGLPWPAIMITIIADEFMIVTGLIGALTSSRYKWGYWSFGTAAFLFVVYQLVWVGRRHAVQLNHAGVARTYNMCGVLTIFVWFLYPVAWGLAEGGNVIHPDSEAIFYGVLDLIAKPVFGFLLLFGHQKIDPSALGLNWALQRDDATSGKRNGQQMGETQTPGAAVLTTGNGTHAQATTTA